MNDAVESHGHPAKHSPWSAASAARARRRLLPLGRRYASVLLLSLCATVAIAASSLSKVVDGVTIYVGIVGAQVIRGQPMSPADGVMHGGRKKGEQYHLMVVLVDAKTGQRITDAEVEATVVELGKASSPLTLSLMKVAESVTYGGYFDLPASGPFRIDLKIRRPASRLIEAQFEDHVHP